MNDVVNAVLGIEGETGYIGREPTVTLYSERLCNYSDRYSQTYLCLGCSSSVVV
jgi:hypothetical protein